MLDRFAAQSKLLLDLPEQIWDCLSSRNYLTATQLFQFASFIKSSKTIKFLSIEINVLLKFSNMKIHTML